MFCCHRTETQQGNSTLHGFVLNVKRPIQSNLYLVLTATGNLAEPTLLRQDHDLPSRNCLLLKLHPVTGKHLATPETKNKASLQLQGVGPLSNPYTGPLEVGNNRNLPGSHREIQGWGHLAHCPGPVETQIRITRNLGRRPGLEVSHGNRAAVWTLKNKTQVSVAHGSYQDLEASLHNLNKFGRQIYHQNPRRLLLDPSLGEMNWILVTIPTKITSVDSPHGPFVGEPEILPRRTKTLIKNFPPNLENRKVGVPPQRMIWTSLQHGQTVVVRAADGI